MACLVRFFGVPVFSANPGRDISVEIPANGLGFERPKRSGQSDGTTLKRYGFSTVRTPAPFPKRNVTR